MKTITLTPAQAVVAEVAIGDALATVALVSGLLTGTWWLTTIGAVLLVGINALGVFQLRSEWLRRDNAPDEVQVQRYELRSNEVALVVLDIGCHLVGVTLTALGQHRTFDQRVEQLHYVRQCKQRDVVTPDDETAAVDIYLTVPAGLTGWIWRQSFRYGHVARYLRKAVKAILDDLRDGPVE